MKDENKNSISDGSNINTRSDARLDLLYEIERILASSETMNEAAPQLLETICRHLGFQLGELWCLGKNETALHLESVSHLPSKPLEKFLAASRRFEFAVGDGLPGKVWAANAPIWIENLDTVDNMPRRLFAEEAELQSGFGFPITLGENFLGAFSFFSSDIRRTDDALLEMFAVVGKHIGQFTQREHIENNLRESEANFRQLAEAVPQFVWVTEVDGSLSYVNEQWLEYSGLNLEQINDPQMSARVFHPDEAEILTKKWGKAFAAGEDLQMELRLRNHSGDYRWFLTRSRPIKNADGKILKWFGTSTDITDGKRAENRLALLAEISETTRTTEEPGELLFAVARAVGEHLQVRRCLFNEIDLEEDLETVHRDYCRGVESVAGAHRISDYSSITSAVMRAGKTVVNGDSKTDSRTAQDYAKIYEPNGERAYVAVPLLRENRWVASLWVSGDEPREWSEQEISLLETIAERTWTAIEKLRINNALRESEEKLRESNAVLQTINQSSPTLIYLKDRAGRLLNANPATLDVVGKTLAEIVGKTHAEYTGSEKESANIAANDRRVIEGGNTETFEEKVLSKNKIHTFLSTKTPYRNERGEIVGLVGVSFDITERKEAEEAIRESEARFRHMADHAPVMIWVTDATGYCNYLSQSWYEFTGQTPETGLGFGWLDATHPDDLKTAENIFLDANRKHQPFYIEYRLRRVDGSYAWTIDSAQPRFSEDSEFLGYIGSVIDITERKASEEKLRESEERLQLAVDISRISTFDINLITDEVQTDQTGRAIYGFEADEPLTFSKIQSRFHPDDRDEVGRRVAAAFAPEGSDEFEVEQRIIRADGEIRWIRVRGRGFFEGAGANRRAVFCLGTYIDITRNKRSEQSLLERERLALLNSDVSRALINDSPLPDILHNCTAAVVRHLDAAFARIWTLNKEENVLELQASSGMYTHLDGEHSRIPLGKFKIGLIAAEHKPHLTNSVVGDERVSDQDWAKRERMISFAGYPLIIDERLVGVIAMFSRHALTEKTTEALTSVANAVSLGIERKHTEAERERLLESEQKAREIAEQANHAKDEFIALVSHELRSPLNAMLGWTRILQNQKPDEKTTDYALDVIVRNARAQSKLIEDLLDIARVGERKLRLEMKPTELVEIINAAVEIIKPAAEGKNINLIQSLDRAANFIAGDDDRLRQVFENLLSNAIKFTPENGTIEVRLEREEQTAKIIVSDTGQGISAEFLPQIFERFKQADHSTTRRHGGLGIGLSLARDLVELHGGAITAMSAGEGKGATFTVKMPLRTVAPIKENSSEKVESMDTQGKLSGFWILAVDDEADVREIVSFMLQINGARVTTANSAVEALEILKNSEERLPDVLLSDISMPNESGYALLEKIRALPNENGGRIPAVALTAFNRPEDRQSAFEAGFQKHLGKPVEMEDLIAAIIETAAKQ